MTIIVQASVDEVRAAIAGDETVADLLPSITLLPAESVQPRRSFGLIPGVETIVDIVEVLASGVAGNAAWTLLHERVFPALVRRFGADKVKKEAPTPPEVNKERDN